jgi:hypothetical protein
MSKRAAPSSFSSGVDGAEWLDVEEDDELEGGIKLKVNVNKMEEGKKISKRTRFRCTVTLHGGDDGKIEGFEPFRPIFTSDPRGSEDAKQKLRGDAMADFRRQKREREQGNLDDTDNDDDGGAYLVCFCLSSILRSCSCAHILPLLSFLSALSLVLFLSDLRSSKRRSTAPDVMNMGPENRPPSHQIGSAHSSLSPAASSKSELETAVAGLLKIKKAHPEHDAALRADARGRAGLPGPPSQARDHAIREQPLHVLV